MPPARCKIRLTACCMRIILTIPAKRQPSSAQAASSPAAKAILIPAVGPRGLSPAIPMTATAPLRLIWMKPPEITCCASNWTKASWALAVPGTTVNPSPPSATTGGPTTRPAWMCPLRTTAPRAEPIMPLSAPVTRAGAAPILLREHRMC
ncbi:hypothetical protein D3C76_1417260 [compost metagenome]